MIERSAWMVPGGLKRFWVVSAPMFIAWAGVFVAVDHVDPPWAVSTALQVAMFFLWVRLAFGVHLWELPSAMASWRNVLDSDDDD